MINFIEKLNVKIFSETDSLYEGEARIHITIYKGIPVSGIIQGKIIIEATHKQLLENIKMIYYRLTIWCVMVTKCYIEQLESIRETPRYAQYYCFNVLDIFQYSADDPSKIKTPQEILNDIKRTEYLSR